MGICLFWQPAVVVDYYVKNCCLYLANKILSLSLSDCCDVRRRCKQTISSSIPGCSSVGGECNEQSAVKCRRKITERRRRADGMQRPPRTVGTARQQVLNNSLGLFGRADGVYMMRRRNSVNAQSNHENLGPQIRHVVRPL